MKLTCISKGRDFSYPPCHILDLCGFRILLECPLDLAALTVFAPIASPAAANHRERPLEPVDDGAEEHGFIRALPRYKLVHDLCLRDLSLIDLVLVSSPASILGLPLLTRNPNFSAKIYATEATARIGRLMMEELMSMHLEFIRFYGLDEGTSFPEWLKLKNVERLPSIFRDLVMREGSSWMSLYSVADVDKCMQNVQFLKYAEEACFNSTLILKAFSSGLEIGSCNWMINGPRRNVAYLTGSVFRSACAMDFDYSSLQSNDVILFSDLASLNEVVDCVEKNTSGSENGNQNEAEELCKFPVVRSNERDVLESDHGVIESSEEIERIDFICSCILDAVKEGVCVLFPVVRFGLMLLLLEHISHTLESYNLKVPMYMISTIAEETFTFASAAPEWLCGKRQQKLFSGEPLFDHVELIKDKRLLIFPSLHSLDLLRTGGNLA